MIGRPHMHPGYGTLPPLHPWNEPPLGGSSRLGRGGASRIFQAQDQGNPALQRNVYLIDENLIGKKRVRAHLLAMTDTLSPQVPAASAAAALVPPPTHQP